MYKKRYLKLTHALLDRVNAGEWKTGDTLPSEMDLSSRFGVSRSTVRRALDRLERMGMISRKRKRGTVLIAISPKQIFQRQIGSLEQLDEFARQTRLHIICFCETSGEALCKRHELEENITGRWIEYLAWRSWLDDGTPVSWTRFAFDALYEGARDLMGKSWKPSFKVIEDAYRLKISTIEQISRAVAMNAEVASMLEMQEGMPAMEVKRLMFDDQGKAVVHAHSIHRADAVSMRMRMELGPDPGTG